VSTADDFAAFARMLLDKGSVGSERLLSAASVESMTHNQLTPDQTGGPDAFLGERGWGFGMAVTIRGDALSAIPGRYGWDGGFGTSWASDPKRDLIGILLTQRLWGSPKPPDVSRDFWTSVYQGVDPPGS
jgi:CubicO group peptidase (beta-lactamase class C family)